MTANGSVQRLDRLRNDLASMRAQRMTWREIAAKYPGVPAGTLCAVAKGREPAKASIRAALGLPVTMPAPVCPVHGVVHARTCRAAPAWVSGAVDWLKSREKV